MYFLRTAHSLQLKQLLSFTEEEDADEAAAAASTPATPPADSSRHEQQQQQQQQQQAKQSHGSIAHATASRFAQEIKAQAAAAARMMFRPSGSAAAGSVAVDAGGAAAAAGAAVLVDEDEDPRAAARAAAVGLSLIHFGFATVSTDNEDNVFNSTRCLGWVVGSVMHGVRPMSCVCRQWYCMFVI
jgi:hypothetical protein